MKMRRAGAWARQRAAARRRQLLREHWRAVLKVAAAAFAGAAAAISLAGLLIGAWLAWFIAGAVYAVLMAMWLMLLEVADPITRRFANGATGEALTAARLRRCARMGWRAVHNIAIKPRDIDHVAVGPGGVLAIESKCPDAGWEWLCSQNHHLDWVRQTAKAAFRSAALIKQHCGDPVDVRAVLVVWTRGLAGAPLEIEGVRVMHGSDLPGFLKALPNTLRDEQVRRIYESLLPVAAQLDGVAQVTRPSFAGL